MHLFVHLFIHLCSSNVPPPGRDYIDNDAAMRAKKKEIEDEMLSQRFKLSISDDGEGKST